MSTAIITLDLIDRIAAAKRSRPCSDAREWAESNPDPRVAWETCERGDWMLWIAARLGIDVRPLAIEIARSVLHYLPAGERRPWEALEVAERYLAGEATLEELQVARRNAAAAYVAFAAAAAAAAFAAADAAAAAAYVAFAAYAVVAAAADVAAAAAAFAAAAAAAADADAYVAFAAYAVVAAAYDGDDVAAAHAVARAQSLLSTTEMVRAAIPWSEIEALLSPSLAGQEA